MKGIYTAENGNATASKLKVNQYWRHLFLSKSPPLQ